MSKIRFTEEAWEDFLYWLENDKKKVKKINALLKDIERNGNAGLGKSEPLKNWDGYWSRRIDKANRLVFKLNGDTIEIAQCKGHYE